MRCHVFVFWCTTYFIKNELKWIVHERCSPFSLTTATALWPKCQLIVAVMHLSNHSKSVRVYNGRVTMYCQSNRVLFSGESLNKCQSSKDMCLEIKVSTRMKLMKNLPVASLTCTSWKDPARIQCPPSSSTVANLESNYLCDTKMHSSLERVIEHISEQ